MKRVVQYKMEFSKKVIFSVIVMTAILFLYVLVYVWRTADSNPLTQLIIGVMALASVVIGFYMEKAKKENMIKIEKGNDYDEHH